MSQTDFRVKKGLQVSGNIASTNGGFIFDYSTNALSVGGQAIALQANVTALAGASANSINAVQSNVNTVSSNVSTLTTAVNTVSSNVDTVSANLNNVISGTTPFTGTVTMQQNLIVTGNLTVGGTTTTIASTDTKISDRVITLSNGALSSSFDTGLLLARGTDGNVFVGFDESADEFVAAYTTDSGANTTTDFNITSFANAHFNNIAVEGLVDGVDVASLKLGVDDIQSNINSVASNVSTVSSSLANVINGTTAFTGTISAPAIALNTQLQISSNVVSSVGAATTTIFSFPGATYRGVELLLLVQDIVGSEYQLSKILVVHDGTQVYSTEYGIIYTGTAELTSFAASIDGSDIVSITSTGGSANKKITVASHYLIQ